jgi:prepilin-type N-terminal cleavage/methylation domain-containing protein
MLHSLKQKKQQGFTIVELLIVIVVIGILATLVIVTFTGIQQKARNSQRQTDINAIASHVEAFYAQYGYYPTLSDLNNATFRASYLKGLDPEALKDPKGAASTIASTATASTYSYVPVGSTPSTCTAASASDPTGADASNNGCDSFTLTALQEGGTNYVKKSN